MKEKKRVRLIVIAVLLVIAAVCMLAAANYFRNELKAKEAEDKAKQKVEQVEVDITKEEKEEKPAPEIPIDFASLQQTNPEVYAWINVPGTRIDYPVLQTEDDEYYLNHTWEKQEAVAGSIYTQKYNSKDFSDYNTVIYGHEMRDGTMFKDLHRYLEDGFMEQNQDVTIYTPEHIYKYKIFSAVIYDDRHLLYAYDFNNAEDRAAFLQSLKDSRDMRNVYAHNIQETPEDKIITMSTCVGSEETHRLLVNAVLVETQ